MNPEVFLRLQEALIFLTCPAAIGFPVWYHLRMRWRQSEMGRHVMGYSTVVALLYLQALVGIFWPVYPGRLYIGLVTEVLLMIVVWWRVIVFVHIRHRVKREAQEKQRREI